MFIPSTTHTQQPPYSTLTTHMLDQVEQKSKAKPFNSPTKEKTRETQQLMLKMSNLLLLTRMYSATLALVTRVARKRVTPVMGFPEKEGLQRKIYADDGGGVTQEVRQVLKQEAGRCINCRSPADLVDTNKVLKLFFVPVWRWPAKDQLMHCNNCGLFYPPSLSPISSDSRPSENRLCQFCDRKVDSDFRFCPFCGSAL